MQDSVTSTSIPTECSTAHHSLKCVDNVVVLHNLKNVADIVAIEKATRNVFDW